MLTKKIQATVERNIAAMLNPRLAVLVTCCDKTGKPNVLTVTWHTPLSHQPPLLGISLGHNRYSCGLISETKEFVINIVGQSFKTAINLCGNYSGASHDKIAMAELTLRPAAQVCPPVISGALGHLECRVKEQLLTGDHTLFVADILHAEAEVQSFSDTWAHPNDDTPLLCFQRDRFGYGYLQQDSNDKP